MSDYSTKLRGHPIMGALWPTYVCDLELFGWQG